MAIENDAAGDKPGPKHPTLAPAEEFISFGDDDDDDSDAASDSSSSSSDDVSSDTSSNDGNAASTSHATFHPHHITLATFRRLLSCYPSTVEQVHRRKAMIKLQPKPAKGSKRKADKKTVAASVTPVAKTEFNPSEEKYIREETEKFLRMDQWRYEEFPRIMAERREKKDGNGGEVLSKSDLMGIMEWKLKHGVFRPMLMGMIKTNPNKAVLKCVAAAMAALSTEDPMLAPNDAFPKSSIDALAPLRGVGVATASLILSIATGAGNPRQQVPFYSDDVYLWFCLEDFPELEEVEEDDEEEREDGSANVNPADARKAALIRKFKRPNGELNVKYNIAEYRKLWDACWELCERLNRAVEAEAEAEAEAEGQGQGASDSTPVLVSHNDIEKVAFVLRNITASGYFEGRDPEDISRMVAARKAKVEAALSASASGDGETPPAEKKKLTKSEKKALSKKEMKAYRKEKKEKKGGRNPVKRRKVE